MANKFSKLFKNIYSALRQGGITYLDIVTTAPYERLMGKTALITGGSSGIGKAIAVKFISEGARVVITGRNMETLLSTKEAIRSESLHIVQGDVSDVSQIDSVYNRSLLSLSGHIDILVNNAGVYTQATIENISENEWNRVIDTNLKGLYFMSQKHILTLISQNKHGKIINISSRSSIRGSVSPYGLSKYGVNGLTHGLAKEYLTKGIIVNGIAPGGTASNINKLSRHDSLFSQELANQRFLLPEEVAEVALFLASDCSNGIIGQTIVIDGGTTL